MGADMTAISATFVQLKPINGRKVVQIVLEAPNEHADAILEALGGYPKPDDPQWVGVAPLNAEAAQALMADMQNRADRLSMRMIFEGQVRNREQMDREA